MKRISKHISYHEATKSYIAMRKGIENVPNQYQLEKMQRVAEECFEPLREWHGKPIAISSFFRSKELNHELEGSPTSDHMTGCAIDIDADVFDNGISNKDIFNWLKANVDFDQLIWEFGNDMNPAWVHVSYRTPETNRRQVLKY